MRHITRHITFEAGMARKNKPIKTDYPNIYEILTNEGKKEYLATWTQKGRQYPQKNLTKLFGATTAKKAETQLTELKVLINKGEDPFKKDASDMKKSFSSLVLNEIRSRTVSENYKYVQEKIYLKHLDNDIGRLKLDQITISVLDKVFRKLFKTHTIQTVTNLKKTIRPTLDYAVDEKLISNNPLNSLKIRKLTKGTKRSSKAPLKHRLLGKDNSKYLNVSSAIYNAALTYSIYKDEEELDREFQIAFLLASMTARRRSEILKIRYEDITPYDTVKTRADTTKTDVWEEYPLSLEVINRLLPNAKGLLTPNITLKIYSAHMRKLIDNLNLPIHADMKLDGHDTRNLFLTIMSKETKNPFLCDTAISHDQSNYKMLLTYYEPDINDHIELFDWYWDLLRGDKKLSH